MSGNLIVPLASAVFLIATGDAEAQTACATQHPNPGVFICYPNPAENPADADLSQTFHFSAQANPPEGQAVRRYNILIDGKVVYQSSLPGPLKKLSIETNLNGPLKTGAHRVSLMVYGAGSAEVNGLRIHESNDSSLCDPFSRTNPRACNLSRPATPLRWKPTIDTGRQYEPADTYTATLQLYSRNLKRMEADASDAIALDAHGNLYNASHVLSDVEIRKYSPDGAILYDSLVRSCGDGFVQVSAIAATDSGLLWIAANTTACFEASGSTPEAHAGRPNGMRGILILVDTTKVSSIVPRYLAWLGESEYRVAAIRADSEGNAYVTGVAASSDFPHQAVLDIDGRTPAAEKAELGFVCALSKSGSALWSTLLRGVMPAALSVAPKGDVLVAGGEKGGAILAEIADNGRRLAWVAKANKRDAQEFRAVATTPNGEWVLMAGAVVPPGHEQRMFFAAVRTCRTDGFEFHPVPQSASEEPPGIALGAALDSVGTQWVDKSPPACRPPA